MTILFLNAYNNYYIWLIVTNEDNLSFYSRNSFSINIILFKTMKFFYCFSILLITSCELPSIIEADQYIEPIP